MKTKKALSLILAFAMVMSLMVIPSFASSGPAYGDTDTLAAIDSYDKAKTHFGLTEVTQAPDYKLESTPTGGAGIGSNYTVGNAKITIDLATETIYWSGNEKSVVPEFISFDAGKKWSKMKFSIGEDDAKGTDFSKFLNKESTIWLCSAYDKKTNAPQLQVEANSDTGTEAIPEAVTWKFEKIEARPKLNKIKVDYLTKAATDGGDGKWTLKQEGTAQKLEVAYSTDKKNPILGTSETYGYGEFPTEGINVVAAEKPGAKLTFLVRVSPTDKSAASKVKKVSVSTLTKAPNLKIDYKKNIIKLKANMIMSKEKSGAVTTDSNGGYKFADETEAKDIFDSDESTTAEGTLTPIPKGSALLKDGISIELPDADATNPTHYVVRTAATEKKPASMIQLLTVVQKSKIYEKDAEPTVKGTSVKLPKGYEATAWADRAKTGKDAKWKTSIKADKAGVYAVRIKNTAKYNAKTNATDGNPTSGVLAMDVAVGKNEKGKDVVTAVTFLNSGTNAAGTDTDKSESSVTAAIYIKAADINKTINLADASGAIPSQTIPMFVKGDVNVSVLYKGVVGAAGTTSAVAYASVGVKNAATSYAAIASTASANVSADGEVIFNFSDSAAPADEKFYAPVVTFTVVGFDSGEEA